MTNNTIASITVGIAALSGALGYSLNGQAQETVTVDRNGKSESEYTIQVETPVFVKTTTSIKDIDNELLIVEAQLKPLLKKKADLLEKRAKYLNLIRNN